MANQDHLEILKQGVGTWNQWRKEHADIQPDLSSADLSESDLSGANFFEADLSGANLSRTGNLRETNFVAADLSGVNLSRASLFGGANFSNADLSGANLSGAYLIKAVLIGTILSGANLSGADLSLATLVQTDLTNTMLKGCRIYGISVWDVHLEGAIQEDMIITDADQPTITVDNLKIAQFIYLLLDNQEIRDVINTLTTKAVLILGRFAPKRKAILDALREELRKQNYLPILFDFEKPSSRNFTETVRTLAHLSRFIIADLTDPSSIPQELQAIVPTLRVPVQPVLLEGKREYAMFVDFLEGYGWVLPIHYYGDQANLLATLKEHVIEPAEQKALELEKR